MKLSPLLKFQNKLRLKALQFVLNSTWWAVLMGIKRVWLIWINYYTYIYIYKYIYILGVYLFIIVNLSVYKFINFRYMNVTLNFPDSHIQKIENATKSHVLMCQDKPKQYPNSNDMMGRFLRTEFVWLRHSTIHATLAPGGDWEVNVKRSWRNPPKIFLKQQPFGRLM